MTALYVPPLAISPFSPESVGLEIAALSVGGQAGAIYPTANLAIAVPFSIPGPLVIRQLFAFVSTASGNLDVGVYDASFAKLISAGSTLAAGTSVQLFDVADTAIPAGRYYLAIAADNTTIQFTRSTPPLSALNVLGCVQMAAAFPLPATITPAQSANAYLPNFGLIAGRVT